MTPRQAHEAQAVSDLIFKLLIREPVFVLQHEHFEHEHAVNGLPARVALARLLIDPQQERAKHLPVNGAAEPLQRVATATELTVTVFKVKEAALHSTG